MYGPVLFITLMAGSARLGAAWSLARDKLDAASQVRNETHERANVEVVVSGAAVVEERPVYPHRHSDTASVSSDTASVSSESTLQVAINDLERDQDAIEEEVMREEKSYSVFQEVVYAMRIFLVLWALGWTFAAAAEQFKGEHGQRRPLQTTEPSVADAATQPSRGAQWAPDQGSQTGDATRSGTSAPIAVRHLRPDQPRAPKRATFLCSVLPQLLRDAVLAKLPLPLGEFVDQSMPKAPALFSNLGISKIVFWASLLAADPKRRAEVIAQMQAGKTQHAVYAESTVPTPEVTVPASQEADPCSSASDGEDSRK